MRRTKRVTAVIFTFLLSFMLCSPAAFALEQKVHDRAGLLTESERAALETLAAKSGSKWDTDFVIVTTSDTGGRTAEKYMADFYDEKIDEQQLDKWNATVLAIDIGTRNLYLGSFFKAKVYMDDARINTILDEITPKISRGQYYEAFEQYIRMADQYMSGQPANILMQWWLQLVVALGIGALVVGAMAYNSGGRVTVNNRTYMDSQHSKVLRQKDHYIRTTVTKVRKPKSSGGGGGGGRTGGGRSYSGGGRSF